MRMIMKDDQRKAMFAKMNKPKSAKQPRYIPYELPIYQIDNKLYYRDVRLGEYRNIKNPNDKIDINMPNERLQKPTMKVPHGY